MGAEQYVEFHLTKDNFRNNIHMNLKPRTYSVNELGKTQKYTVYNEIIGQEIFVNQNLITIIKLRLLHI